MKNVTITLDEEVARWARIWAAREDTSVSRLLGQMLKERMMEERRHETARESFLSRSPLELKRKGGYPSRDRVHER